ncbi:hypothetical protein FDF37_11280 [Clostridium botulinum]|nr:hypothetical protein [Clostridium botulinum]MBD5591791.1 hypothetical protein [Clostridium botulinum]MCR1072548.1 hypothetical protein [Clostridium botulinum]NFD73447.1 hypothetical protein [Clostridium botulinum]NFD81610.1 hypothetical protein [Clostridium botulinum]NFD90011.1 hypothetical protein [Clostridium botulinum]
MKTIKIKWQCKYTRNKKLKEGMLMNIKLWIKRVKCAMFCNKPFELLNYYEKIDKGIVGAVKCPKCGNEMFILNKRK